MFWNHVQALQRTIEFEEELADKFGGSGSSRTVTDGFEETDTTENNNQTVLDIRKKYEKKLAAHQGDQDDVNCFIYLLLLYFCSSFRNILLYFSNFVILAGMATNGFYSVRTKI